MPQDVDSTSEKRSKSPRSKSQVQDTPRKWFTTPRPIKRLFDRFPLRTYPVNELPLRSPSNRDRHSLWIFTTKEGARLSAPSFNPGCLKWQAYLMFQGIEFVTVPSNNHASPTGALPFLLPASNSMDSGGIHSPVPSTRIERWIRENKASKEKTNTPFEEASGEKNQHAKISALMEQDHPSRESLEIRYEAYMSLLNYRIRNAYLFSLYLSPQNFASIVYPLYIEPNTSSTLARYALSYQLRAAAETELLKQLTIIDVEALYRECDKAFEALSELLGDDEFFFGEDTPALFDAIVFAYTHVFLDEGLDWKQTRLQESLKQYGNLVEHQKRITEGYFAHDA